MIHPGVMRVPHHLQPHVGRKPSGLPVKPPTQRLQHRGASVVCSNPSYRDQHELTAWLRCDAMPRASSHRTPIEATAPPARREMWGAARISRRLFSRQDWLSSGRGARERATHKLAQWLAGATVHRVLCAQRQRRCASRAGGRAQTPQLRAAHSERARSVQADSGWLTGGCPCGVISERVVALWPGRRRASRLRACHHRAPAQQVELEQPVEGQAQGTLRCATPVHCGRRCTRVVCQLVAWRGGGGGERCAHLGRLRRRCGHGCRSLHPSHPPPRGLRRLVLNQSSHVISNQALHVGLRGGGG